MFFEGMECIRIKDVLTITSFDVIKKVQYSPTFVIKQEKEETRHSVRKNDGKVKMRYMFMFPTAMKAVSQRLEENENKYPNDQFSNYVPEETIDSLGRHISDLMSPNEPVHDNNETKLDALKGILFNALCLVESTIVQEHKWAKGEEDAIKKTSNNHSTITG